MACTREPKLLKYLGLVYAMFRRQLPGCLNAVWQVIQDFDRKWAHHLSLPDQCRLELMAVCGVDPFGTPGLQVAVQRAGDLQRCVVKRGRSLCLCRAKPGWQPGSAWQITGQLPELRQEHRVLTIGLFDGYSGTPGLAPGNSFCQTSSGSCCQFYQPISFWLEWPGWQFCAAASSSSS